MIWCVTCDVPQGRGEAEEDREGCVGGRGQGSWTLRLMAAVPWREVSWGRWGSREACVGGRVEPDGRWGSECSRYGARARTWSWRVWREREICPAFDHVQEMRGVCGG